MNFLIIDGLFLSLVSLIMMLRDAVAYTMKMSLLVRLLKQPSTHWVYGTTHEEFSP
jgi:hypothetical protein